jgi:hypothetical protein
MNPDDDYRVWLTTPPKTITMAVILNAYISNLETLGSTVHILAMPVGMESDESNIPNDPPRLARNKFVRSSCGPISFPVERNYFDLPNTLLLFVHLESQLSVLNGEENSSVVGWVELEQGSQWEIDDYVIQPAHLRYSAAKRRISTVGNERLKCEAGHDSQKLIFRPEGRCSLWCLIKGKNCTGRGFLLCM